MQYSTSKQLNKNSYKALVTALTELTCFGKSELLQQVVDNLKKTDYTKHNPLDHNIFLTLFVHLLLKQHPELAQGIIQDPANTALLGHLQQVKQLHDHDFNTLFKTLEDIKKNDTLRPKNTSGK